MGDLQPIAYVTTQGYLHKAQRKTGAALVRALIRQPMLAIAFGAPWLLGPSRCEVVQA